MARKILTAILGTAALVFALLTTPFAAQAQDSNNDIGTCLADEDVWLLVVDDTGEVLANQCVGNPDTGTSALEDAGLQISRDGSNFLCAIGGHPAECPATFDGAFWNYYTGTPGSEYEFSQVGSDEASPVPGSIEAWCYSTPEEQSCTPPYLKIVQDGAEIAPPAGQEAVDLPTTSEAMEPDVDPQQDTDGIAPWIVWTIVGVVIVIAAIVVIVLIVRRPTASGGGTVGGR